MSRVEYLRSLINADKLGLEIGPSHTPTCPKSMGFKVEIIDHLDADSLREKYKDHPVDVGLIEHVDYVWGGEKFADLTGKPRGYGWIVASHVVEHAPDLIGFLNDCSSVLEDDGVLVLAIPDKRFCFDHYRERTSLSRVIDAHFEKRVSHSIGTAAEVYLNLCEAGDWLTGKPEQIKIWGHTSLAKWMMDRLESGEYIDMHAWCFTPASFRLVISDLFDLKLIDLRELKFHSNDGYEFFCVLSRHGPGPLIDRDTLARQGVAEVSPQYVQSPSDGLR